MTTVPDCDDGAKIDQPIVLSGVAILAVEVVLQHPGVGLLDRSALGHVLGILGDRCGTLPDTVRAARHTFEPGWDGVRADVGDGGV